jgi:hypothetical protein
MGAPQASQPALASSSKVLSSTEWKFPFQKRPKKTIPKNPLPKVSPKTFLKNGKKKKATLQNVNSPLQKDHPR